MSTNEQNEELDFNTLVTRRAGPGREEQVDYLVKVVMHLMMKPFERDARLPDSNVLHTLIAKGAIDKISEKYVLAAMKVLDTFYYTIACSVLDDPDFNPDGIRSKVMQFMNAYNQRNVKSEIKKLDVDVVAEAILRT